MRLQPKEKISQLDLAVPNLVYSVFYLIHQTKYGLIEEYLYNIIATSCTNPYWNLVYKL